MKIVDNIAHKLYLGVSKIPGAGVGLFTGVDILSGKPICEYKGEVFAFEDETEEDGETNQAGRLSQEAQLRLGEKYAYTLSLGFDRPSALYAISWRKQYAGINPANAERKMIDAQPSLTEEEMGLGSFINDKRGYLERTGEEYEEERKMRDKKPKSSDDLKQLNELDLSLGYNSTYWSHPTEVLVYLLTIRDVKAGEEIYVNYGHQYWTPFIKKVEKDKAEQEAKKTQEQPETEPNPPPKATMVSAPEDLVSAASENTKDE